MGGEDRRLICVDDSGEIVVRRTAADHSGENMNRRMRLIAAATSCVLSLATGCATMTRGTTQAFTVETTPLGATVSMSNGERCETPCTLKLKRKYPLAVHVCKAGYAPVTANIVSSMSGAGGAGMAGNVIVGGLIGVGVDAASGATKDLKPNPLVLQLVADAPGCESPVFPTVPQGGQTPESYRAAKK